MVDHNVGDLAFSEEMDAVFGLAFKCGIGRSCARSFTQGLSSVDRAWAARAKSLPARLAEIPQTPTLNGLVSPQLELRLDAQLEAC